MTLDLPAPPDPGICVLGATGLLGTALTAMLARRPGRLRLVGRRAPVIPRGSVADIEVQTVDLRDPRAMACAVDGMDRVIHLLSFSEGAATWRVSDDNIDAEAVNVGTVRALLAELTQRTRPSTVVFAGSVSQQTRDRAVAAGVTPDISAYDRHKSTAEDLLLAAARAGTVRGVSLRLATLYASTGETAGRDTGVATLMTWRALIGEPLTVWNGGTTRRDLLTAEDAAGAFVAAIDHSDDLSGRPWVIGSGHAVTVRTLFEMISAAAAAAIDSAPAPVIDTAPAAHSVPTDTVDFDGDPTLFTLATGWRPTISLARGLGTLARALAAEACSLPASGRSDACVS